MTQSSKGRRRAQKAIINAFIEMDVTLATYQQCSDKDKSEEEELPLNPERMVRLKSCLQSNDAPQINRTEIAAANALCKQEPGCNTRR